jgi:hypothetical protein
MSPVDRKYPDPMPKPGGKNGFFYEALKRAENHDERVRFKDRGIDELAWRGRKRAFNDSAAQRLRILQNPALAILEDAPIANGKIQANPTGLKKGYNPYDSGKLSKTIAARRRDLRRLSEWLKLRKQAKERKPHKT